MEFNRLIPELAVSDLGKSLEFYTKALGFKVEYQRPESKFAFLSYNGSQIMLEESSGKWQTGKLEQPFGRGVNFQIETDDAVQLADSIKNQGHALKMEPKENWYRKGSRLLGQKEFLVMDPDGYLLRFAQSLGKKGMEK
jgi:catechol 2,3-dioxygenase-like lactoylglutathione lyase family enzyme